MLLEVPGWACVGRVYDYDSRHLCPPQIYKNSWLYTQNSRWFRVQGIGIV